MGHGKSCMKEWHFSELMMLILHASLSERDECTCRFKYLVVVCCSRGASATSRGLHIHVPSLLLSRKGWLCNGLVHAAHLR